MRIIKNLADINTPVPGDTITVAMAIVACDHLGLPDLVDKLKAFHPDKSFVFDGCSCWLNTWNDKPIYKACFIHDVRYFVGGTELERLEADTELMLNIAHMLQNTRMAEIMFHGTRVGGTEWAKQSFSWGFGKER